MDGFRILQLPRVDPRTSSLPVLIETGFSGEGMEEEVEEGWRCSIPEEAAWN